MITYFQILIVLLLAMTAQAQNQGMTLLEALATAQANNPALAAQRQDLAVAEALRQKAAQPVIHNPEIDLEWETGLLFGEPAENDWALRLSQQVEIGGQRGIRIRLAEITLEDARLQVDEGQRQLEGEVKRRFYQLLHAQEKRQALLQLSGNGQALLEAARQRYQAQDISQLALSLAEADHLRIRIESDHAQAEVTQSQLALGALLQHSQPQSLQAAGALRKLRLRQEPDELIRLALAHRPDFKRLELALQRAAPARQLLAAEALPDLTFHLGFKSQNGVLEGNGLSLKDNSQHLILGVSAPLPLISLQPDQLRLEAETARREAERDALRHRIQADVLAHYENFEHLAHEITQFDPLLSRYSQSMTWLLLAYQQGEVSLEAALTARQRYLEAWMTLLERFRDHALAFVELETAVNYPLEGLL